MDTFSSTDLVKHDKYYRLKTRIENRYAYLYGNLMHSDQRENQEYLQKLDNYHKKYIIPLRLVNNNNNYQHYLKLLRNFNKLPKRKEHLKEMFNIQYDSFKNYNPEIQFFINHLKQQATEANIQNLKTRLWLEFHDKSKKNWFMVFSTLTVDANHYKEVFEKGSDCWRNYIRSFERMIARETYGSYRKAKGKDYFKYFAVVETGSKNDRLHIHVIKWFKNCTTMQDPNTYLALPNLKGIKEFEYLWKYGFSEHIPIRWSASDAFGLINWRWRVEQNDNKEWVPIEPSTVGKMAGYLVKYLFKAKKIEIMKEVYTWKVRQTQKLGMEAVTKILRMMTQEQLEVITAPRKYPLDIRTKGIIIPSKLIRNEAIKFLYQMKPKQNPLPKDTTLATLLKNGIGKRNDHNSRSFGDLTVKLMTNKVIYNIDEFVKVALELSQKDKESNRLAGSGANVANYV
jgi:hypothetical protein